MKKSYLLFLLCFVFAVTVKAQAIYQPYSYQFYQKLNSSLYSTHTDLHTSMKPAFMDDSILYRRYDSLMKAGVDSTRRRSWGHRKLFQEHLIDVRQGNEYTFFADFLPDLTVGRDLSGSARIKNTWLNTRGYQLGGTVGKNFYFYSSGYENQAVFPDYMTTYINQLGQLSTVNGKQVNQGGIINGQAYDRSFGKDKKDWSYITALISYTPVKYLNITLGQDKNFIGDGYRSMLLSDYAAPYPFLKLTATLGKVRYMAMWAYMTDPAAPKFDTYGNDRRKWGVFHYLDWNVTNRLSLGFFDAVVWAASDDQGHPRGFDFEYVNPIIFLRPAEAAVGSPDNAVIGFNGKYKITDGITAYGQFTLDEFESKNFFSSNGSSRNKYAYQLGFRGANLFGVRNLNYLAEYNGAKPYTFSERGSVINYAEEEEPLAHPWGANFREVVGLLNYTYRRFDFSGEVDYGNYGLDYNTLNYGKNPYQDYTFPAKTLGNYTGQGLVTNMAYVEGKVAYVLNPKYNLRIELGAIYRNEKNNVFNDRTRMITIGLRSSFRNIYNDITSVRSH